MCIDDTAFHLEKLPPRLFLAYHKLFLYCLVEVIQFSDDRKYIF